MTNLLWDLLAGLTVGSFWAPFLLSLDNTLDTFICVFMCHCNVFVYQQCLGISAVYPSVYFGLYGDGMIQLCFGIYAFVDFSSKLNPWWEAHIRVVPTSQAQYDFKVLEWSGFFPKRHWFTGENWYFDDTWGKWATFRIERRSNRQIPWVLFDLHSGWEVNFLCTQALSLNARHSP